MIGRLRRLLGAIALTSRARMQRDAALLLVLAAVAGGLAAWSQAALRSADVSIDRGAAEAVASGGSAADLVVRAPVGVDETRLGADPRFPAQEFLDQSPTWGERLPAALRSRSGDPTTVLISSAVDAEARDGAPDVTVTLAVPDTATGAGLRLVAGRAARDPSGGTVEVVVPQRAAASAALRAGSTLVLQPASTALGERPVRIRVVGIVAADPAARTALDADLPGFTRASTLLAFGSAASTGITAFTTAAAAQQVSAAFHEAWTGVLRLRPLAARYDAAAIAGHRAAVDEAAGDAQTWSDQSAQPTVRSDFDLALADFAGDAAAAAGRQRSAIAGALAVGLLALLLLAGALAAARTGGLEQERVRGLTGGAVAVRAGLEALLVALPAVAVGAAAAALVVPGPLQPLPLAAVLVTAVLAPAVAEVRRAVRAGRSRARALVGDAALVLLAAAAVLGLRSGAAAPDDPLLVVAPVLVALAGAALVRRLAAAGAAAARPLLLRDRGAVAAVAAARPSGPRAGTALTAIAVASAVAVGGAVVLADLDAGRTSASWRQVGADVRVAGDLPSGAARIVASRPGVTEVAAVGSQRSAVLVVGDRNTPIGLLAVDSGYFRLLAATPDSGAEGADPADAAASLTAAGGAPLPVLVSPSLAARQGQEAVVQVAGRSVRVRVAGVAPAWPADDLARKGVLVDAAALAASTGGRDARNLLLVDGPGAAGATQGLPGIRTVRAAVLAAARAEALPAGTAATIGAASAAAAVLALLALAAWLRSAAAERRRERALLAVLGLPAGTGRRLLLLRTAPLLALAVLGGGATGVLGSRLLAPVSGLERLADVGSGTASVLPVLLVALGVALAALAVAAVLEPSGSRTASLPAVTALTTDGAPT